MCMHSSVIMQSCMSAFQLSPVAMRKRSISAFGKLRKLAWRVMFSCILTYPNRFMPITAKMKKKRKSTLPTLTSAGSEKMSVWKSVRKPFALGMSRKMRATRKMRSSERYDTFVPLLVMATPTMERHTTLKSKAFHVSRKYGAGPSAKSLSAASMRKMPAKAVLAAKRASSHVSDISACVIAMKTTLSMIMDRMNPSKVSVMMRWNTFLRSAPSGSTKDRIGLMSTSSF
mmetsp:Transcript_3541/g.12712  ORF Transcript_3541/g.12712 Transcript_3541/m.12712 type:complete len:229 (+) Transcript_3541:1752-2438(+)